MTAYLYRPITMYSGRVLKCCGMASEVSRRIVQDCADGKEKVGEDGTLMVNGVVVETSEYRGDRIVADTLQVFTEI